VDGVTHNTKSLQARIVSGSIVLLSGSGLATAINLAYNVAVARFLGPVGFGHATVIYTLLTLISAVTLSFQIISAKVVAQQHTPEDKAAVYRTFHRAAIGAGILIAAFLLLGQRVIAGYLNLDSSDLVAIIAVGIAFYVPLGCRRGFIQGSYGFRGLATNLVLEGAVRLGGSLALVLLGWGVRGVVEANAAAIAVAYFAISPKLVGKAPNPLRHSHAIREMLQALNFYSGQLLINNCDIVLVNHFFLAHDAGLYSAVAMVGRVIFTFSQAVVNSTFPIVAGGREEERKDLTVIATSLMMVLLTGTAIVVCLFILPASLWTRLFGAEFAITGKYNIPYLLAFYAISTVVYSLSAVIITFEMSYKIANTSWVQLAFSFLVILGISRFHSSLREVILIQLFLMLLLLVLVALPFVVNSLTDPKVKAEGESFGSVRLIRRASEDEVIAEFLKSDFHRHEFREYQTPLGEIVSNPNLEDADQNAKRRALFYIRHLALWKEIPAGTEWFELEVSESELAQIRVFPRAHWRKLGHGNFSISQILNGMKTPEHAVDAPFMSKIDSIRQRMKEQSDRSIGSVLLIGLNENEPLTIIDGNHRMVSALLESPHRLKQLRFLCGFSPRMMECCWYNTNLMTLFRYGKNVLTQAGRDPEAELERLLQTTS
jgi:O-antigen/teichoic acid export membrane protein